MTPSFPAHPGPEELDALLDPGGDARVGRHVRDCEQCRGFVHDLREVRAMLRDQVVQQSALVDPPPEITSKIFAALAAEPPFRDGAVPDDRPAFFDDAVPVFDIWDGRAMSGREPLTDDDDDRSGLRSDTDGRWVRGGSGPGKADVVELRPRRRWALRLLAAAAGLAVIGGAGTALWRTTQQPVTMSAAPEQAGAQADMNTDPQDAPMASASPGGVGSLQLTAANVYTSTNLDEKVHALLQQRADGHFEADRTPEIGSALPRLDVAQSCLTTLGAPDAPLAVDVGTWEGQPALIIVADSPDPTVYTVYAVDQQCQAGVNGSGFQTVHSIAR